MLNFGVVHGQSSDVGRCQQTPALQVKQFAYLTSKFLIWAQAEAVGLGGLRGGSLTPLMSFGREFGEGDATNQKSVKNSALP